MSLKKGFYNSILGILVMFVTGIISFVKISFVINNLGQEYNGLNNLYSQVFSFLMIGEAGIGLATTSMLYEHIEKKNFLEINKIISGSRKILGIILSCILILSIVTSFFIPHLIKESTLSNSFIMTTFLLFSFKLILIQYFQPLKGFVAANQDEYIIKLFQIILSLTVGIGEILILFIRKNYIEMLIFSLLISILMEFFNYLYLSKKYDYIIYHFKEKNYKAGHHIKELVKVNIVSTVAKSIDPIIISKILGLVVTSIYSNYSYVQNFLLTLVGSGLGGFTHYFGNVFLKKDSDRKEKFDNYIIITNFLASFFAVMFFIMIQDFISLWINKQSGLDRQTGFLFSMLVYIYIIMKPINTLVVTNKFFKLASKSAIYEVILNVSTSLVLIKIIGLKGVLLGSILSFLFASFWYFPINTYYKVLECSSKDYFFKQLKSFAILLPTCLLMLKLSIGYISTSWYYFVIKGFICSFILICINLLIYLLLFKESKKILINIVFKLKK